MEQNQQRESAESKAKGSSKRGKKRREKKQVIEISLWINGCKYEHGLLCTFCTKKPAVVHCPECGDFYCFSCDSTAHNTKKRKHHVRSKLSHLDKDTAAGLVTRAVRRYALIKRLQRRCREVFRRHFDRKSLCYYYYNSVNGTVSWRKPYCLRHEELFPFMPRDYAASKCQNLYHIWRAREKTRSMLLALYFKVFDRQAGRFYYAFHGKSPLLPRSSWNKPRLLGKRAFPKDLMPVFTADVAAITIQRKWRAILIRQFFRALVRASYDEIWDPVKGRFNYYHRESAVLLQDKPKLLGNEAWDPNRVSDWSIDQVSLFLRRIGLKQYVEKMKSYNVDGNALVLLDDEDYENLDITNRLHIRKIRVEINNIFDEKQQAKVVMSADHEQRREKIRRQKMFHLSAVKIQRQFRRFSAQKEIVMLREIRRVEKIEEIRRQKVLANSIWWTENKSLPSKKLTYLPSIGSNGAKLPPIKSFGRNRDHLSQRGWSRRIETFHNYRSVNDASNSASEFSRFQHNFYKGKWESSFGDQETIHRLGGPGKYLQTTAAILDPKFLGEGCPTLIFSEKLFRSGHDAKRMEHFLKASGEC